MFGIERFSYTPFFNGLISDVVSIPIGEGRKLLFLSGVAANDPQGKPMQSSVPQVNIEAQTKAVWARIGEILSFHGGTFADIVKITIYVTDGRYLLNPVGRILKEVFNGGPVPVSTGLVVAGLAYPEMLVEIDVTAVVGQAR